MDPGLCPPGRENFFFLVPRIRILKPKASNNGTVIEGGDLPFGDKVAYGLAVPLESASERARCLPKNWLLDDWAVAAAANHLLAFL